MSSYDLESYLKRKEEIKNEMNEYFENKENYNGEIKKCTNSKCKKELPIKYFIKLNNSICKHCLLCRELGKYKDSKKTRKDSKQNWKNENREKVSLYTLNYRQRKINKNGEEYWKKNAENAKKWRENNPEKANKNYQKKLNNIKINYNTYVSTSNKKNIKFDIDFDSYCNIVNSECFYCKSIGEKGFNGIDKKIYNDGYTINNCVSCCKICNYIKGTLSPDVFYIELNIF